MEETAEVRCLQLAARQHGVVEREQALAEGLTGAQVEWRVVSGRWERLYPGVYRVGGAAHTWRQRLKALCLWGGQGAAISHRSAAALLGFGRFREGPLELTLTRRARAPHGTRVHRAARLLPRELLSVDGICVTSATRTIVDLSAGEPRGTVRASLEEALRRRWTTFDRLQAAIERAGACRGIRTLEELVEEQLGGPGLTESELEARVLELLEESGLPRAVRQQAVRVGGRLRRLDFRIPGTRVVIEAGGYAYHAGIEEFERDRARNNALTVRGLIVLHWTWWAVRERPEALIAELRTALASSAGAGPHHWAAQAQG